MALFALGVISFNKNMWTSGVPGFPNVTGKGPLIKQFEQLGLVLYSITLYGNNLTLEINNPLICPEKGEGIRALEFRERVIAAMERVKVKQSQLGK